MTTIELPIQTERLTLRAFEPDDLETLHAYQSRSDVTRFLLWGPRDRDEVREALAFKLKSTGIEAEGDVLAVAAQERTSGAMVGDLILHYLSRQDRTGEIGYIIHPDHQGHGYATEAGRALLRVAFDVLGWHRVVGHAEPRNTASTRVLEKLGMRREAHFVENEFIRGEWQSEVVYAILDREWAAG